MTSITVTDVSDETYRALLARAASNGRSVETEILEIIEGAVRPKDRIKVGSELAAFGDKFNLDDLHVVRERD